MDTTVQKKAFTKTRPVNVPMTSLLNVDVRDVSFGDTGRASVLLDASSVFCLRHRRCPSLCMLPRCVSLRVVEPFVPPYLCFCRIERSRSASRPSLTSTPSGARRRGSLAQSPGPHGFW
jgi:hypothetical protein